VKHARWSLHIPDLEGEPNHDPEQNVRRGRRARAGRADSIALLQHGAIRAVDFITATRPLEQVAEAFELSASGAHVKVLIAVTESRSAESR